jgi:hypothetical protein
MRINPWKVSTIVLASALALVVGGSAVREAAAEPQPHMRSALELLRQADAQLTKASSDKGGHRVAARGHLAKAIDEVKKGIEFDSQH